jgi:uncharacterized integral membrane protein
MNDQEERDQVELPNRWIGPLILLAIIVIPIAILVFSNTDTITVTWAGLEWEAPQWLVLTATFVAGAIGSRLLGWLWRQWRKRRRKLAAEVETLRKHRSDQDG